MIGHVLIIKANVVAGKGSNEELFLNEPLGFARGFSR
jgi:hypothetical protein